MVYRYYKKTISLDPPVSVKRCDVIGFKHLSPNHIVYLTGLLGVHGTYLKNPTAFPMYDVKIYKNINTTTVNVGKVVHLNESTNIRASMNIKALVGATSFKYKTQCPGEGCSISKSK